MWKYLVILLISLVSLEAFADSLVLVTTISSSRRRFVINLGTNDGIVPDQTRAFSTDKISLMCYAIETSPDHSLWEVHEADSIVPFHKNQVVLFHTNLLDDRTRRHLYKERQRLKKLRESGDLLFEDFDYESRQMGLYMLAKRPKFIVRGGLGRTLQHSVSSADAEQNSIKSQINFEGLYSTKVLAHRFDWGTGFRWDQESEEIEVGDEKIIIPHRRFMLVTEFSYHLDKWKGSLNNFYLGAGTGLGKASSEVNSQALSGTSFLLPYLKFGLLSHMKERMYLVTEFTLENMVTKLTVDETGEEQSTSSINAKVSVGIRF